MFERRTTTIVYLRSQRWPQADEEGEKKRDARCSFISCTASLRKKSFVALESGSSVFKSLVRYPGEGKKEGDEVS